MGHIAPMHRSKVTMEKNVIDTAVSRSSMRFSEHKMNALATLRKKPILSAHFKIRYSYASRDGRVGVR